MRAPPPEIPLPPPLPDHDEMQRAEGRFALAFFLAVFIVAVITVVASVLVTRR